MNKAYVDDAIAKGGWAIRELHGIEDTTWEDIPTADYLAHLDYVKAQGRQRRAMGGHAERRQPLPLCAPVLRRPHRAGQHR